MTVTAYKNARLLDPATGLDEIGTLVVENGKIQALGADAKAPKGATVVDCHGLCLAPGLIDMRVAVGEPGYEQRETIQSASRAAAAGGITAFAMLPNTDPVIDDIAGLEFVARRAREAKGWSRSSPMAPPPRGANGTRTCPRWACWPRPARSPSPTASHAPSATR